MKRLFSSVFILFAAFCLTACSVPVSGSSSRENKLGCAFTSAATITLDKLNAEGTISRLGDGEWEAEFDSPNTLSGVKLTFSEGNVGASYKGLEFSVPKSALPVKAMLLQLIEAVDTNAHNEELKGSENEGMFEVSGSLEGGDYTLKIDENGNISSFEMPNNLLYISFSDVRASETAPQTSTEPVTEETTETTTVTSQ